MAFSISRQAIRLYSSLTTKYKTAAANMIITNECGRDDGSTYVFKALNQLAERNPQVQETVNVLELKPSNAPYISKFLNWPYRWPPKENEDNKVLDRGARLLQINEPEFVEFKAFCDSRRQNGDTKTQVDNLIARWPDFAKAFADWRSCKEIFEIPDHPDSAMILFLLSLPNLEKLVIHDQSGYFIAAMNGIFHAIGKENLSSIVSSTLQDPHLVKGASQMEKKPVVSDFLKNLRTLHIKNALEFFPLQLIVPILSFVPLQELRMQVADDIWIHPEVPDSSLVEFQWITPNPLMTISKLVIHQFDTGLKNLREFLSKAKYLETLWLGIGSWDFVCPTQSELIKTISDTVGSTLKELMLTYWYKRDDRYKSKPQTLDFRAFSKLTRLSLHARCWEDGETEGHSLNFSVDDNGKYDFLPQSLVDLYLFKKNLEVGSCTKFLDAVYQTKQKAESLENIFFVADKDQIPPDVSDVEQKLATVGVKISTAESDVPEEYLEFLRCRNQYWRSSL